MGARAAPLAAAAILAAGCATSLGGCGGEPAPAAAPARIAVDEIAEQVAAALVAPAMPEIRPEITPGAGVPAAAPASVAVLTIGARLLDDEARPLAGGALAWLVPGLDGLPAVEREALSDLSGAVWLGLPREALPAEGPLVLALGAPGCQRTQLVLERGRWEGREALGLGELGLRPGGRVSGLVRDEHGAALAGATVGLTAELGPLAPEEAAEALLWPVVTDLGLGIVAPLVRTDAAGRFVLEGMPTGRFAVVASLLAPGATPRLADREEGVVVGAGEETRVRPLVLREPRAAELVAGVVLGPRGQPVEAAELVLEEQGLARGLPARSSASGRFALLAPEGRRFSLVARDPASRWPPARLEVSPGGPDLVLRFVP